MPRFAFILGISVITGVATSVSPVSAAVKNVALLPASERFSSTNFTEVPSLQRHVLPLMGRLGCNGRACHGSFQGQGGFRLSLFGYDFKADHDALVKSEESRVDLKTPRASLILTKPTSANADEHGGGKRMDVDSWQYRVIEKWIAAGAPAVDSAKDPTFVKMVVTPTEIVCRKEGDKTQLTIIATWSDGTVEDVTPLCRFTTNDEAIAKVDLNGVVTCVGKGDTHVVTYYDNGVVPISVLLPVTDRVGPKFPEFAANTKVDELVLAKLRKLGVVPSNLSNDADFLRRASLDITGQLPAVDEVKAFLADKNGDKRARKIDELLARPAYAAWWTNKLCDVLGNTDQQLRGGTPPGADRQWYRWLYRRVVENMPYDDLIEGIILANGRSSEGQTLEEYSAEMTSYVRRENPADFAERETMPYFWMRRNLREPNQKALAFSYALLGVRLQCAECHKHPFDQWSQADFQNFTAFFSRIQNGQRDKKAYEEMIAKLKEKIPEAKGDLGQKLRVLALEGTVVPWSELYVTPATEKVGDREKQRGQYVVAGRVITPKVLGGSEEIDKTSADPRQPLMDWLRQKDNPYFARSFVNRVWAHYFNVGIVEPADDMNLANAPSNKELLDYLAAAFVEHGYDMRWLMREITLSDAYQRSWETNTTNVGDLRNFSHAVPRRMPAEVVYDAVQAATAGRGEAEARRKNPAELCAVGMALGYSPADGRQGRSNTMYAMTVFGKPKRETACDCERSNEPSLLQSVFLRNDQEMYQFIERQAGWLDESANAIVAASGQTRATAIREFVSEAYLRTFSRFPTETEVSETVKYVERASDRRAGLRDVVWALLNAKEFVVNH